MSGSQKTTNETATGREIVCSKCGHHNRRHSNVCGACGAHLHVVCHHCGHRNERFEANCVECGHHLHRSWTTRLSRRLFGKRQKISPFQILLLVVGVALGFWIILLVERMKW